MEINPLDNAYTSRDYEYLKSKSLDVRIIVRKLQKKVTMKSTLPVDEVRKMLMKEVEKSPDET